MGELLSEYGPIRRLVAEADGLKDLHQNQNTKRCPISLALDEERERILIGFNCNYKQKVVHEDHVLRLLLDGCTSWPSIRDTLGTRRTPAEPNPKQESL